jgi:hypothetical protein
MRVFAVIATAVLSGCLLPSNEISGRWNVGGDGGCTAGDIINVSAPGDYGDDDTAQYRCTDRAFSINVPEDLHEFAVVFDVWPLADRGQEIGATVELTRVIDDFNLGLVTFVPVTP